MPRTEPDPALSLRGLVPFPLESLAGSAEDAARGLLGSVLVSTLEGEVTAGRVVETEAYPGPHDPASHAAARIGRTPRNDPMFGPPGTAYVYRIYGLHWCLNVVTGPEGDPAAVLVRAVEPLAGARVMARRRGHRTPLGSGPGRLCQAMGVTGAQNRHDLQESPLRLHPGSLAPGEGIEVSGRIGIREARDWPLRFFVRGNRHVSASPR